MYRGLLLSIGVLETIVAGALIAVGFRLPNSEVVEHTFGRVGQMTETAEKQVQLMREQVGEVRQKDFPKIAREMRSQTETISTNVRASTIDFVTVEAMSEALGATAHGLESWSETLDPDKYLPAGNGLGSITDLLEGHEKPGACGLENDFRQLINALERRPNDQTSYEQAITRPRFMGQNACLVPDVKSEPFATARAALREWEASLEKTIAQIDAIRGANYPFFSARGIEMRPVWPEAAQTAAALRGVLSPLKTINRDLLGASHVVPTQLSAGDRRPVGPELQSEACRPTLDGLREIANGFRQSQRGLTAALRSWPTLVETMHRSAIVLRGSQQQLDTVLSQREQYERAVHNTRQITKNAENLLESYTTKLDDRLGEQQRSLGQMEGGLHEVSEGLPDVTRTASDLLLALRCMFWLVGGLVGVHGLFLSFEAHFRH